MELYMRVFEVFLRISHNYSLLPPFCSMIK